MPSSTPRPEAPPARAAALDALVRTLDRRQDVQAGLDAALASRNLSPADTALASELVYGVLRLGLRIDFILSRFLRNPSKSPVWLKRILRLSAYEMLHLDKIPAYASVSWAVEAAKCKGGKKIAGLANAVLRRVAELAEAGVPEDFFADGGCGRVRLLSRLHSCPEWIVKLWIKDYGEESAVRYLEAQAAPPALGAALDSGHPGAENLARSLEADPRLLSRQGWGFALTAGPPPQCLASADPSAWRRQSFAARQALLALDPESWDGPVWDACAGQGGKTRLVLEAGAGPVLASDVHTGRLSRLRDWIRETGAPAMAVTARAEAPPPLLKPPATVVLDVPCTGLGVLSRRPDIKWKRRPKDMDKLAALQTAMLDNALAAVRPGGAVAYVTCTLSRRENESAVESALKTHRNVREITRFSTGTDTPLGEFFFASLLCKG